MHKHEKKLEDDRDEADSSVGDKKKMACYKFFCLIVKLSGFISREQKFSSVQWKLAFHRPTMH